MEERQQREKEKTELAMYTDEIQFDLVFICITDVHHQLRTTNTLDRSMAKLKCA
jgi:hypothetical protein